MPINRGPFNALVDDDGSNTIGTVWNKAQIQGVILDPADAAYMDRPAVLLVTTTGTIPILPTATGSGDLLVVLNPSGPVTIQGIASTSKNGQRVTIYNASTFKVDLTQDVGGAPVQLLNWTHSAPTSLMQGGSASYVWDGVLFGIWRMTAHEQGSWIMSAFNAANFTAPGGAYWQVEAGDVLTLHYRVTGCQVTVAWYLVATSLSTITAQLSILSAAYGGYAAARAMFNPIVAAQGGVVMNAYARSETALIAIQRADSSTWATSTNGSYFFGQLTFEVI